MPWLDDSAPAKHTFQKWKAHLRTALLARTSADRLSPSLRELAARYPTAPTEVANILLSFRASGSSLDDPLLFDYARVLLREGTVSTAALLYALLDTSQYGKRPAHMSRTSRSIPSCEERMFNMLTRMYISGDLALQPGQAHDLVHALALWLHAVSAHEMDKQLDASTMHPVDAVILGTYEAIASLAITILGSQPFREASGQAWWKKRREVVVREMISFDTHVLLWVHSQLAGRLQALTNLPPFMNTDSDGQPIFTDEQILSSIVALPIENTRAGLFIWLNAALCARPHTDDLTMLTYLQARYPGNNQSLMVDLLIASFDVLTNALIRKEHKHHILVLKSFICNKLPHLLSLFSALLAPAVTVEACISMAFMAIPMNALPPISAGATELTERLKVTRREFLQACALHGLTSETTIASVLGEAAISLPRVTKHTKEGLTAQCATNIGRFEPYIDELDGMLGNAGAIAGSVVDVVNQLCVSKDTMSLKTLCNMLLKKPLVNDIIMQYTQPANLLLPICNQLNEWIHDQDQTEFTPAYEEFASILLYVLVVVHRYDLSDSDLGISSHGSTFITSLLQNMSVSKSPSDLTEEQSKQLGKWIEGLFATDESGETGGISDEVMRHCPPQAFYQLVPTLFDQLLIARKTNVLTLKTFNGGLELLVEPFLLPSLVGGFSWLVNHSWEDRGDANILLQILEKLLKPSSSSQETKIMHRAVLGIIAEPLHRSLHTLSRRQPDKKQVAGLMNILEPHINQRRTVAPIKAELEEWRSAEPSELSGRICRSVKDLVSWATNVGASPPPRYTHRLYAYGCSVLGANSMRDIIVAELAEQTGAGRGAPALDICTAVVCASSDTSAAGGQLTVRDVLRIQTSDLQGLLKVAAGEAESVIRLGRRVEEQLAITQIPELSMTVPAIGPQASADQVMAELGLTDHDIAAADVSMDPTTVMDEAAATDFSNMVVDSGSDQVMSTTAGQDAANMAAVTEAMANDPNNIFGDLNMDMNQSSQQQMLNMDQNGMALTMDGQQNNAEEDIFAGLDDMNFGGDDFNF